MVDAINGGSNIKPKDLTINWKECTASEVMEYKDEGQEIPTDILVWAQDMAKTDNADEITYEMSMDGVGADTEADKNVSAGAELKNELDEMGLPIEDQARTFRNESDNYSNMIRSLEDEMSSILEQSEEAAASVQEYTNSLLSQIQTLQAKQEKAKSDKTSQFGALEANQLDAQIKQLGNLGLSNIDNQSLTVYNATNGIGDALNTAVDATSIGNTTVEVGTEMIMNTSSFYVQHSIGLSAIKSGNNAINTAAEGTNVFNSAADDNKPNEDVVNDSKNSITRASGAAGAVNAEEEETETDETTDEAETVDETKTDETAQNVTDKFEQDREAKKEEADIDPTLADTSITTDPTEILKRKERKGLA